MMTLLENGNINPFDCGIGWRIIYIYIKGCQVLCLKLSRFIVYFIFNRICGVEKRGKEKGRVEEE